MSVRRVKLSLLLMCVPIAGLLSCGVSLGAPQDIVGTWNIAAELVVDNPASMYGTIENHYRTYNYITGATIETGLEAWKFRAAK